MSWSPIMRRWLQMVTIHVLKTSELTVLRVETQSSSTSPSPHTVTRNTSGGWSCTSRWPLVWSPGGSGGRPAMSGGIMLPLCEVTLISPVSGTKLKYLRQRLGHTWKNLCELILCCQQFPYFINIGYLSLFLSTGGFLCWPWTRPTGRREALVFWSTRHFCKMSDIILTARGLRMSGAGCWMRISVCLSVFLCILIQARLWCRPRFGDRPRHITRRHISLLSLPQVCLPSSKIIGNTKNTI